MYAYSSKTYCNFDSATLADIDPTHPINVLVDC